MRNPLTGADRHLSTEEFWTAMCQLEFVRLSLHYGRVRGEILYCGVPPELVPGFIERVEAQIVDLLQEEDTRWTRFLGWLLGTGKPGAARRS